MISNQNSLLLSPICSVTTQQTTENYSINFISNSLSKNKINSKKIKYNRNIIEKREKKISNFQKYVLHNKLTKSLDKIKIKLLKNNDNSFEEDKKIFVNEKLRDNNYKKNNLVYFKKIYSPNISRNYNSHIQFDIFNLYTQGSKIYNYKVNNKLSNTCKNILKINNLLKEKEKNYKKFKLSINNKFNLCNLIKKNYEFRNNNLIENYLSNLESYNIFLYKIKNKEEDNNYKLLKKEESLKKEIYNLKKNIEKFKSIKNNLILIRNFLICVKEKILILPKEFLENCKIFDNNYNIKTVFYNNNNNDDNKNKINLKNKKRTSISKYLNFSIEKNLNNYSQIKEKKLNIINFKKTKFDKYLNRDNNNIFSDISEFIEIFNNLNQKNLKLLKYNINLEYELKILKNELNEYEKDDKNLNNFFNNYINKSLIKLNELKLKNKNLQNQFNLLFSEKNKKNLILINNNNYLQKIKNEFYSLKNYYLEKSIKFNNKFSYIYYLIGKTFNNCYKLYPKLFSIPNNLKLNEVIEILKNPENYNLFLVNEKTKKILLLLEQGCNTLLSHFKFYNNINNNKYKQTYDLIKKKFIKFRNIKNNKTKIKLMKGIDDLKLKKFYDKIEKNNYRIKWGRVNSFDQYEFINNHKTENIKKNIKKNLSNDELEINMRYLFSN